MRIGRSLPPAAAPIPLSEIFRALPSCFHLYESESSFEKDIKQEFRQRYCLLVSSGKAALVLTLKALHKLHPTRDEVLIPAFTCFSVPAAIKRAGLKIRLCDTGTRSLDFGKEQLSKIIEADKKKSRILCVIVTHLFGCPADFTTIQQIVGDNISIVEDAAQAMGQTFDNKKLGTLGDVGFFSLGRGKSLSTIEGGVIVTNRPEVAEELKRLSEKLAGSNVYETIQFAAKAIGTTVLQHPVLFWLPKAVPFLKLGETIYQEDFSIGRMSSLQVRLALEWQKRLQGHQKTRTTNSNFWKRELPAKFSLLCSKKQTSSLIRLPVLASSAQERDKICRQSEKTGCGIMQAYPAPISAISQISADFSGQHYPNAKYLADCLLTLPVHEYVQDTDRRKILRLLNTTRSDID